MMFKKMIFATALCASFAAFADESTLGKFAFGIEAGADFGNASTASSVSSGTRTGYAAGLSMDTGITPILSLQPEILFVQDGSEVTDGQGIRIRTSLQTIRIPVMLKARLGQWKFAPYVFAGPVANWHVGSSVETVNPGTSSKVKIKNWDFGVAGGVGLDVGPFFANARYDMGLTNLDDSGADLKSRGILIMAGLRI